MDTVSRPATSPAWSLRTTATASPRSSPRCWTGSGSGTVEDAVEVLRPEFEEWRRAIDPTDTDDEALAGRFDDRAPVVTSS